MTFFPEGFSFDPKELSDDSWSQRMLDRWQHGIQAGNWNKPLKTKGMGVALEAEIVIMTLYVGACLLKFVDSKQGGLHATALLLRRCHDLVCGLSFLLGVQKKVMPGPLASGRFKPSSVSLKLEIPKTLLLLLNVNFLVRLMIDMADALAKDPESAEEAYQTVTMCSSFESPLWDAEAR